jgi:hypothetical protein
MSGPSQQQLQAARNFSSSNSGRLHRDCPYLDRHYNDNISYQILSFKHGLSNYKLTVVISFEGFEIDY